MNKAKIYYHDIGDYLNREEKLAIIKKYGSVSNVPWETLSPNEHGDWLNQRNDVFNTFIPIEPGKKFDLKTQAYFNTYSLGVSTNRDAWIYGFSKNEVEKNTQRMIAFYNEQRKAYSEAKQKDSKLMIDDFIDTDSKKISWTVNLKSELLKIKYLSILTQNLLRDVIDPFVNKGSIFKRNSLNVQD